MARHGGRCRAARFICRRVRVGPGRVLTITHDGDRLYVQETGRPKFEVAAHGADAFASDNDDFVIFLRDGQAKVTQVLFQEPVSGSRLAPRVAAARAKMIEEEFARRIAEAPDRFQGTNPVARQQGGDPAGDRGHATRRSRL